MSKTLYRNIETDVNKIGEDGKYPTQFVCDKNLIKKTNENPDDKTEEWTVDGTNIKIIVELPNFRAFAIVDGIVYNCLQATYEYDYDKPFSKYYLSNGKVSFSIVQVFEEALKEGLIMGAGMQTFEDGVESKAESIVNEYDGDSFKSGVKCKKSNGTYSEEVFRSYGWYADLDPGYERELEELFIKSKNR